MTGPAGQRPRLVLLPGMLCDEHLWDPVLPGLAGVADVQHARLTAPSIDGMVEQVLAGVRGRVLVAGLSLGGIVAALCAARFPDRVAGVALLASSLRAPTDAQRLAWNELEALVDEGRFAEVPRRLLPGLVGASRQAALRPTVLAMAERIGSAVFRDQLAAQRTRRDYRDEFAGVGVPVTVLAPDADAMCPPGATAELAALPGNGSLHPIGNSGHLCTLENPAAVVPALREWLAGLDSAPSPMHAHATP